MENKHQISKNLSVAVEEGKFVKKIRITRNGKSMPMSASMWKLLHQNLEKLRTSGQLLNLSPNMRLEVKKYNDRRYVSFVQFLTYRGGYYENCINFYDEEWTALLEKMSAINNMLFGDLEPKRIDCDECHGVKTPIHLTVDKQIKKTKLSKRKLASVLEYNVGVQNQIGLMCTYCGVEGYDNDDCHCHRYDCSLCEDGKPSSI